MKRIPIVILITALIISIYLFLNACCFNPQKIKPDKTELFKAEKTLSNIDKNYKALFDSLKIHSDSLENELIGLQYKLKIAKVKLNQSQIKVVTLAKKDTDSLSVAERLTDCDSLKAQTLVYVNLVDSTRSIYDSSISQLNNLVAIKDSQIVICAAAYTQLKNLMEENLIRERKLSDDLNTAYKVQRKKKLQNKILTGGILLLSGITTTLYINANK